MKFQQPTTIQQIIDYCGPLIDSSMGPTDTTVDVFDTSDSEQANSFSFINNPKFLEQAMKSQVKCFIANARMEPTIKENPGNKTWLFSKNPDLAAREVKKQFVLPTPFRGRWSGVHPTAVVDPSVQLGENVVVGPHAIIGARCVIGDNCFVGANAVIEEQVTLGKSVTIHPLAYIGHSCEIGNFCEIMPQAVIGSEGFGYAHDHLGNHYRIPHTGKVILEDDVHVGAGTAIDRGTIKDTRIGRGSKLDNQIHLAHNTELGSNGIITAQVVTAGSTRIGDNFICGGKTAITGHIEITDNVNVAGFSGVSKSVTEPGQYGGYPLLPLKDHLKVKASSVHLPELRKQMSRVLKKLFPEDS